jgi:acyl-[acyl-carrier-protein]-phospholipid O-acyltransferase / long-chain-fatty-acid--[acyl-carrier-protein] ligase
MTSSPLANSRGPRLDSPGFLGLLVTQFLGAFNDNMFRWLAVPLAKSVVGDSLALALGLACFTLPYLLLAAHAGYLADRFSKRSVIVGCKVAEIAIMALGLWAIARGDATFLFVVVALMGAQSALFGPAKMGAIPEMISADRLSQANGVMALTTVVAAALGFIAGNYLYGMTADPQLGLHGALTLGPATAALLGVAAAGWAASLYVQRLPAADATRLFPVNPLGETWHGLKLLGSDKPLLRTALGISFFWFLASLAQMTIDPLVTMQLHLDQQDVGLFLGVLVLGLGTGSVLAGVWSGGKVELGIVPIGAVIISVSAAALWWVGGSVDVLESAGMLTRAAVMLSLFSLGFGAGFFNVPLESFMQHRSDRERRGTILAANNFLAFSLMLGSAGLFWLMTDDWSLDAGQIFLVCAIGTIPVIVYVVSLLPQATIRAVIWLLTRTIYRVRTEGRENLPETGGALLVANHVSWMDGVLLLTASSRPIRMIAYADYVQGGFIGWLAKVFGVIPIDPHGGAASIMKSLKTARQSILDGELVCIFAEGEITRTGGLLPFQRGMMPIIKGTDVPVIPIYLDGLWGSLFSYSDGRFFWKRPQKWPYPLSINFGKELRNPDDVHAVRQAVQYLGVKAMEQRKATQLIPPRVFLRKCRQQGNREKIADSSGVKLSARKVLLASLVLRRVLRRNVFAPDEQKIGILLPPSAGGVLANTAVAIDGRVAVNLNYTMSDAVNNYCVGQAGIKHVLTSRRFLEKKPTELEGVEMVMLEDIKEQAGLSDKLVAAAMTYLCPLGMLERSLGLTDKHPDDLFTIIFTSGSTGEPKGVMLSYNNIMTNVQGVEQMFHLKPTDVLLGTLPFFHSFGFTGTLWLVLCLEPKGVYHFNPLDSRMIGKLCEEHNVTITMATPTFLRSYLKRCTKEQFHKLDTVVVGAEKLPLDLADEFEAKFGVYPTEGFGTTELSPVVAVNVPAHRMGVSEQKASKPGTVGRPLPGVSVKVTNPDTGEELGADTDGLIWIAGPNVMNGYLNQPEKTAEAIQDGWYNTGDIGKIDSEGFLEITGRLSRFSKLGGEMVPHILIENELNKVLEQHADHEAEDAHLPQVAVTAVPDDKKGERIVVLHRPLARPLDEVLAALTASGLPNLWIPSRDSFVEVEEIPLLGTGKLDLKGIKQAALEKFAPDARGTSVTDPAGSV